MSDRLERMLAKSRNFDIASKDGVFVNVSLIKYKEIRKDNKKPRNEFEEYIFKSLGQNIFNNYYNNDIDDELRDKINVLRSKFYDIGRTYIPQRARFIS
ncbi:MAG: hypothetical protein AABW83_01430 [Nanoarchaeota archaeon]